MAEVVEYRVEKTIDELNLLVEFGLFTKDHAKEVLAKREKFEYVLRRRNKTKLDFLKYIKFEMNLLESIEKYRKSVIKNYHKQKKKGDKMEELEQKILLLQARKLNDVIRARSTHVSSLFRKLTISFQFDKKLWLAYIEFAKSRNWNTRVTSLYWRLLRVSSDDPEIWLAAASHEVDVNRTYDIARGLYLRALRHHPKNSKVWAEYFKMEVRFMDLVDQRARIVFKTLNGGSLEVEKEAGSDIWAEKEDNLGESIVDEPESENEESFVMATDEEMSMKSEIKPIDDNDKIISGHLPRVVYDTAMKTLDSEKEIAKFLAAVLRILLSSAQETKGTKALKEHVESDICDRISGTNSTIIKELAECRNNLAALEVFAAKLEETEGGKDSKRLKSSHPSRLEVLYECHENKGLNEARKMFETMKKSPKDRTLSLYVGMVQIEIWQLDKDKSQAQLDRIRSIYDQALMKFGRTKPKLWYEYLQFEHDHSKSLDDVQRINQLYTRAQVTLEPSKVDRVIEKYTLLQASSSSKDVEYSDYSDLED